MSYEPGKEPNKHLTTMISTTSDEVGVNSFEEEEEEEEVLFWQNVVPYVYEHLGFTKAISWYDCLRDIAYWNSTFNISKRVWSTMCYIVGTHLIGEAKVTQDIRKWEMGNSILEMPKRCDFEITIPRYTRHMCYPALKMLYPVGITQITGIEYSNKIYPSLCVERYDTLYVLRSPLDTFMFVAQKSNGQLLLCYKGVCKKLTLSDINYYYDNLDCYKYALNVANDHLNDVLYPIADTIRQNGGSGYIHGTIIDIDCFNHIKYFPDRDMLVGYYAESTEDRYIYTPHKMLSNSSGNVALTVKTLIERNVNTDVVKINPSFTYDNHENFYTGNSLFSRMQFTVKNNIVGIWDDEFDENIEIWNAEYAKYLKEVNDDIKRIQ